MRALTPPTIRDYDPPDAPRRYLTFRLGSLHFAIDYGAVHEVRTAGTLERLAPDGDLRQGVTITAGTVIDVLDLRGGFKPVSAEALSQSDVIIMKLSFCQVGILTDGVTNIAALTTQQIKPLTNGTVGPALNMNYLVGLAEHEDRMLIVIDIETLLTHRRCAGKFAPSSCIPIIKRENPQPALRQND